MGLGVLSGTCLERRGGRGLPENMIKDDEVVVELVAETVFHLAHKMMLKT